MFILEELIGSLHTVKIEILLSHYPSLAVLIITMKHARGMHVAITGYKASHTTRMVYAGERHWSIITCLFSPSHFLAFLTTQSASSTALCMICSILSGLLSSECVLYSFTNTQIQHHTGVHTSHYRCTASGTSDNGHSEKRTTSVERTSCLPPTDCIIHSVTSEIGTTSLQWTRGLSPLCPLFGGSTVSGII